MSLIIFQVIPFAIGGYVAYRLRDEATPVQLVIVCAIVASLYYLAMLAVRGAWGLIHV